MNNGDKIIDKEKFNEDLASHPFFASEINEDGELHPCIEALQQLKYDPDINTPEELAASNKEEGNMRFKKKQYKYAVRCYTDGIKQKCSDDNLNAELYSNRAAANFYLGNYGSALKDVQKAKSLKPDYLKAIVKGAQCYHKLERYQDCISWCNEGLTIDPSHKVLTKLKQEAENSLKKKLLAEAEKSKTEEEERKLISLIEEHGITLTGSLAPAIPLAEGAKVFIDENGYLVWPVLFLFTEFGTSYLIPDFNEYSIFKDHLLNMFESRHTIATWIPESYTLENTEIFFKRADNNELVKVDKEQMLSTILRDKLFVVVDGMPTFFISARHE